MKLQKRELSYGQLRKLSDIHHVPGFSYTEIRNGKVSRTRTFGIRNSDTKEPIEAGTIYEAASLTKTLFAVIVLRYIERGVLQLDDSLQELAPNLAVSRDPRAKKITPRIALSHGTGFPGWGDRRDLPIAFEPGTKFRYSGEGYYWLQHVLEEVTEKDFCTMMQEELLVPLGMRNSYPVWCEEMAEKESHKFDANGVMQTFRKAVDDQSDAPEPNAAWSLYTSTEDYAKYLCAVLKNHAGLSDEMFREQSTVQNKANEYVAWGLGWGLCSKDPHLLWHWGDNGCYRSLAAIDYETKDGLCIFCNGCNGTDLAVDLFKEMTGDTYWDVIASFIAQAE